MILSKKQLNDKGLVYKIDEDTGDLLVSADLGNKIVSAVFSAACDLVDRITKAEIPDQTKANMVDDLLGLYIAQAVMEVTKESATRATTDIKDVIKGERSCPKCNQNIH